MKSDIFQELSHESLGPGREDDVGAEESTTTRSRVLAAVFDSHNGDIPGKSPSGYRLGLLIVLAAVAGVALAVAAMGVLLYLWGIP